MSSQQQTIGKGEPDTMGIKCFVQCTSNKIDTAKGNVRSINYNFSLRDKDDNPIGTGNNLNINNISPESYRKMCDAFGVDDITPDTPFYCDLMTLMTKERIIEWQVDMARKNKKVDKDQTDVTKQPEEPKKKGKKTTKPDKEAEPITDKQVKYINEKFTGKGGKYDAEIKGFLKKFKAKLVNDLNKFQGADLIHKLKEIEEKKPSE